MKKLRFSIEIDQKSGETVNGAKERANKVFNKVIKKVAKIVGDNGVLTITSGRKK